MVPTAHTALEGSVNTSSFICLAFAACCFKVASPEFKDADPFAHFNTLLLDSMCFICPHKGAQGEPVQRLNAQASPSPECHAPRHQSVPESGGACEEGEQLTPVSKSGFCFISSFHVGDRGEKKGKKPLKNVPAPSVQPDPTPVAHLAASATFFPL